MKKAAHFRRQSHGLTSVIAAGFGSSAGRCSPAFTLLRCEISQYQKLETPFYYEYAGGFTAALDYAPTTVLAVTIPFVLLFIQSFLGGFSVLSDVLGLLPDQLLQINMAIKTFTLYEIGGKVIGSVPIILTIYSVLFLIILPVLYQVYRKTEIK